MIQAFQRFTQSIAAKIFLIILAITFAAFWGGSSYFMPKGERTAIAEVGGKTVTIGEFRMAMEQQRAAIRARTNQDMSLQQMAEAGMAGFVLHELIATALLDLEAENLNLAVSDMEVLDLIHNTPAFHNEKGVFDRMRFDQILHSIRSSEDRFIQDTRKELVREQLKAAIMAGAFAPQVLSDSILDASYQTRKGMSTTIKPENMPKPANPGDDVLEAFYTEQKDGFMTPELRSFTVLTLSPSAVLGDISVSEDDIQRAYADHKADYGDKPLKQVRAQVIADVKKRLAADKLFELSQKLEDEVGGGASFEEIASAYDLKLFTINDVTLTGNDAEGDANKSLLKNKEKALEILNAAFNTEEGMDSTFTEADDGSYFNVRVDKLLPAQPQEFAAIKNRVYREWASIQQMEEAYKSAEKIAQRINAGGAVPGTFRPLPAVSISSPNDKVSEPVMETLYRLTTGKAGVIPQDGAFTIVYLKEVIPPSRQTIQSQKEKMEKSTQRLLEDDLLQAYLKALRIRHQVKINWNMAKAALG